MRPQVLTFLAGLFAVSLTGAGQTPAGAPAGNLSATLLGQGAAPSAEQASMAADVGSALALGHEAAADAALARYLETHKADTAAVFLQAVIARSRSAAAAKPLFEHLRQTAAATDEGRCAALMLKIDGGDHLMANYLKLVNEDAGRPIQPVTEWLKILAAQTCGEVPNGLQACDNLSRLLGPGVPASLHRVRADLMETRDMRDAATRESVLNDRATFATLERSAASLTSEARSLMLADRLEDATRADDEAIKLDDRYAPALTVRGMILLHRADAKGGAEACEKAAKLDPNDLHNEVVWGQCLERLGQEDKAFALYKKAARANQRDVPKPVTMDPEMIALLPVEEARGEIIRCFSAGAQAYAETAAGPLIKANPDDAEVLFLQGLCVRSRFEVAEAAPYFRRAAALAPESPHGQCAALMLALDGKKSQAIFESIADLIDAHPEDPLLLWIGGIASRTMNNNADGVVYYTRLLKQFAVGPVLVYQTCGNLVDELGDEQLALAYRKMAVKLEPAGWSYDTLGLALGRLGFYAESDAAHANATRLQPDNERHWSNWGYDLLERGHYQEAAEEYEKATHVAPEDANAFNQWGRALMAMGKQDEALQKFEKSMALDPDSPYARNNANLIHQSRAQKANPAPPPAGPAAPPAAASSSALPALAPVSVHVKKATLDDVTNKLDAALGGKGLLAAAGQTGTPATYSLDVDRTPLWQAVLELNAQHPLSLGASPGVTLGDQTKQALAAQVSGDAMMVVLPFTAQTFQGGKASLNFALAIDPRRKLTHINGTVLNVTDDKGRTLLKTRNIGGDGNNVLLENIPLDSAPDAGAKISLSAHFACAVVQSTLSASVDDLQAHLGEAVMVGKYTVLPLDLTITPARQTITLKYRNGGTNTTFEPFAGHLFDGAGKEIATLSLRPVGMDSYATATAVDPKGPFRLTIEIADKVAQSPAQFKFTDVPFLDEAGKAPAVGRGLAQTRPATRPSGPGTPIALPPNWHPVFPNRLPGPAGGFTDATGQSSGGAPPAPSAEDDLP